ncbi:MAG: protein kinase [Zoogloeaceae bacterium]|jgi:serine/threonine protein kinase|nr:protein kinase [Zoogloeaceae bacterium]
MTDLVRLCPVCEAENPPERAFCHVCASSLAEVDFVRRAKTQEAPTEEAAAKTSTQTPADVVEKNPEADGETRDAPTPEESSQPLASEIPVPPTPPLVSEVTAPDLPTPNAAPLICPAPDCGQPNPPGSARCRYCNTLLSVPAGAAVAEKPPAPPVSSTTLTPLPTPKSAAPFELAHPELDHVPNASGAESLRIVLPRALAARFRVLRELAVSSSESDLMIVTANADDDQRQRVLKLYRRGVRPDAKLLARVREAGPHVVQVFEYGMDEGFAWTLMEYCRAGNLQTLLRGRQVNWSFFRRLTEELSAGVRELHAQNILHRDLKPENVLIRRASPLSLALSDFGIASLSEGTRLFTDNARTVKYAAPEALTGVLDTKADWWSTGMILLEAASGKHPFDGLSEQVVNHHLATRPILITGVLDPRMEKLCRGLLLRDPERRWGAAELERWLEDDSALPMPKENLADLVRPFRLGEGKARNTEELAALYAASPENWKKGTQDLQRGLIQTWIKEELHDYNLLRNIHEILAGHENADRKFMRFLYATAPDLPPCWLGRPLCVQEFYTRARQACENPRESEAAKEARTWLASVQENDVCAFFASRDAELDSLAENWRQTLQAIHHFWETACKARHEWMRKAVAEEGGVVNFDALVYGLSRPLNLPPSAMLHPFILLALTGKGFLALEQDIQSTAAELTEDAPWFAELTKTTPEQTPIERAARLIVGREIAGIARQSAAEAREKRKDREKNRQELIAKLRANLVYALHPFLSAGERLDANRIDDLRNDLAELRLHFQNIHRLKYTETPFLEFLREVNILESQSDLLENALDRIEPPNFFFALLESEQRALLLGGMVMFSIILALINQSLWPVFCVIGATAAIAAWRWWTRRRRRFALRLVVPHLQRFQRSCVQLEEGQKTEDGRQKTEDERFAASPWGDVDCHMPPEDSDNFTTDNRRRRPARYVPRHGDPGGAQKTG